MSFTPAVSDFPQSIPPTIGQKPEQHVGAERSNLALRRINTVNTQTACSRQKVLKKGMARARKARARLRRQNRVRAAVRNN